MVNFIPDLNRFNLSPPPQWWLMDLYTYDSDAVIIPSRMEPVFRLTRRHKNAPRLLDDGRVKHPLLKEKPAPDTIMCAEHGLIPSLTLSPINGWDPEILEEIFARDMWRVGGATKAAEIIENREIDENLKMRQRISEENFFAAEDMFLRFQHQSGKRVSLNSPLTQYNPFVTTPRKDVKPPTSGMRSEKRPLSTAPDHPHIKVVSG